MSLTEVTPNEAADLVDKGARLVDVREPSELIRERIPGAVELPLSQLAGRELDLKKKQRPVFICRSGARSRIAADRLVQKFSGTGYNVTGGLVAWKRAGLPVEVPGDPASRKARLAANVATTVAAAGLTAAAYGFLAEIPLLGGVGAVVLFTALLARGPLVSAILRGR